MNYSKQQQYMYSVQNCSIVPGTAKLDVMYHPQYEDALMYNGSGTREIILDPVQVRGQALFSHLPPGMLIPYLVFRNTLID